MPELTDHEKAMRELNRLSERFYDNGDVNYRETVDWAIDKINRLIAREKFLLEQSPIPDPCPYCNNPPVVLDEIATGQIHIGCRYAYFRPETDEARCKTPLSVIGMKDRKTAVERWNQECKNRAGLG